MHLPPLLALFSKCCTTRLSPPKHCLVAQSTGLPLSHIFLTFMYNYIFHCRVSYHFQKHKEADCRVTFPFNGGKEEGCLHQPTPSADNAACVHFRSKVKVNFTDSLDEVIILRLSNASSSTGYEVVTKCFRDHPGRQEIIILSLIVVFHSGESLSLIKNTLLVKPIDEAPIFVIVFIPCLIEINQAEEAFQALQQRDNEGEGRASQDLRIKRLKETIRPVLFTTHTRVCEKHDFSACGKLLSRSQGLIFVNGKSNLEHSVNFKQPRLQFRIPFFYYLHLYWNQQLNCSTAAQSVCDCE